MDTLGEDYVRTARAKGAPEQQVMRSHVLRNALLPIVTMLGMDIGIALGGAIFTETIFGLPGLGRLAVQALGNFDRVGCTHARGDTCGAFVRVPTQRVSSLRETPLRRAGTADGSTAGACGKIVRPSPQRCSPGAITDPSEQAGWAGHLAPGAQTPKTLPGKRSHVHVERARLAARMARLEVAEPAAVLHLAPVLDARCDDLLEQSHQSRSFRAVEVPEEPLDGHGSGSRNALRALRSLRRELERDDTRVLSLSASEQPVVLEPVDEPHGARVREVKNTRKVIDRAATVDAKRCQRGRTGGRVPGGLVNRSLDGAGDRHRHRA